MLSLRSFSRVFRHAIPSQVTFHRPVFTSSPITASKQKMVSTSVYPRPAPTPLQVFTFLETCERAGASDVDIIKKLSLETEFTKAQLKEGIELCGRRQWIACKTTGWYAMLGITIEAVVIPLTPFDDMFGIAAGGLCLFAYLTMVRGSTIHLQAYRTEQQLLSMWHIQEAAARLHALTSSSPPPPPFH